MAVTVSIHSMDTKLKRHTRRQVGNPLGYAAKPAGENGHADKSVGFLHECTFRHPLFKKVWYLAVNGNTHGNALGSS